MRADQAAATGGRDGPFDGVRPMAYWLARMLLRSRPDLRADPIRVAADALATPADDRPADHVAGRLVPVAATPPMIALYSG